MFLWAKIIIYQCCAYRRTYLTNKINTGTSINGPITAAKASPELMPNTEIATAIANSKLFPVAVNAIEVDLSYGTPLCLVNQNEEKNIITKYNTKGIATSITSNGSLTIYSPLYENITIIVKRSAINVTGLILGTKRV